MEIAIIGAGHIGGNIASRLAAAGHRITVSFSRDAVRLQALADEIRARVEEPPDAVLDAEIVVISVPWSVIPTALEEIDLNGKIVIDTTNQFGAGPRPAPNQTAAAFNAQRMTGARYTKSFNTLTAGFQAEVANRPQDEKVVQWLCGDDHGAKEVVAGLIRDAGYVPVDLGGTADCTVMEAPRRPGAVYGEEYRLADAQAVVEAVRTRRPIPPTPEYA
ncbi:MAG TPA: NAD(P)-binding domain-containing protein [Solirubrobacteraceae bacterium]|nr:NAD(P)-binding domain-containing protein [Solirubrobacteraceae bacterium]